MKTVLNKRGYCVIFIIFCLFLKILYFLELGIKATFAFIFTQIFEFIANYYKGDIQKANVDTLLSALDIIIKNEDL